MWPRGGIRTMVHICSEGFPRFDMVARVAQRLVLHSKAGDTVEIAQSVIRLIRCSINVVAEFTYS